MGKSKYSTVPTNFQTPDARLLFSKLSNQAYLCLKTEQNTFSDFTDPVKSAKMTEALKKEHPELTVTAFGGFEGAERVMLGFSVNGAIENGEFPVSALKIKTDRKFNRLEHRDILGAVLGLGIDRGQVGDILIREQYDIVFAKTDMAEFIAANLFKVGRTPAGADIIRPNDDGTADFFNIQPVEERRVTVSSLRVDAVAAAAFSLSRGDAAELIRKEKVFINWSPVTSAHKTVNEGDMLTVRGEGRVKILALEGTTKKERFVLKILKY